MSNAKASRAAPPLTHAAGDTRAMLIYRLLGEAYGIRPWVPRREPLHELISTMLSHRTTGANEAKAFTQLWSKFGSWEAIAAADPADIATAIAPANFAEYAVAYRDTKAACWPSMSITCCGMLERNCRSSCSRWLATARNEPTFWYSRFFSCDNCSSMACAR